MQSGKKKQQFKYINVFLIYTHLKCERGKKCKNRNKNVISTLKLNDAHTSLKII